jgi:hypothetical protein
MDGGSVSYHETMNLITRDYGMKYDMIGDNYRLA